MRGFVFKGFCIGLKRMLILEEDSFLDFIFFFEIFLWGPILEEDSS